MKIVLVLLLLSDPWQAYTIERDTPNQYTCEVFEGMFNQPYTGREFRTVMIEGIEYFIANAECIHE